MAEITEVIQFINLLNDLQAYDASGNPGFLREVLDRELERLVKAARKTSHKTKLSLEISIKPDRQNSMHLSCKVSTEEPKLKALPLEAYTDRFGRLYAEDPYQTKLPLGSVETLPTEVKA